VIEHERGKRLTGAARTKAARILTDEYVRGKSIRVLAQEHGLSIGLTRNLLVEHGVTFRTRGGAVRRPLVGQEQPVRDGVIL
jgi:hypothetical protein